MDPVVIIQRLRDGFLLAGRRLPLIFEDPRAYPRETMIVALIGAVLLLVTALAVVYVYGLIAERATRRALRLHRRPGILALRWLGLAGVLGVAGLMLAAAPMLPATSEACGLCHAVKGGVESWRADVHSRVGCYACHARPGFAGALEASARGVSGLYASTRRPPADTGGCAQCHASVLQETLEVDGLRVRHFDIAAAGISCLACHDTVGHAREATRAASPKGDKIAPRPRMTRCLQCHEGKTASAECDTCHVGRQPSDSSDFTVPFGDTPAPARCDACHPAAVQKRCTQCHGLDLPHPPSFMGEHAGMSARNPALCAKCHETASSQSACACHQETNEHGTYSAWFPVHGVAASQNGPGGCRCHSASFCGFCHERSPFP